jgi:hypothetical protein
MRMCTCRNICGNKFLVSSAFDKNLEATFAVYSVSTNILSTMSVPLAGLNCHMVRLVPRISRRVVLNTRQSSNSAVSEAAKQNLSWPEYLEIRRSKRKWETVRSSRYLCSRLLMKYECMTGHYHSSMYSWVRRRDRLLWFSGD